jgi:hypothetical protein
MRLTEVTQEQRDQLRENAQKGAGVVAAFHKIRRRPLQDGVRQRNQRHLFGRH